MASFRDPPQVPTPEIVSEWIWSVVRATGSPCVSIRCKTRAVSRIWQAILAEVKDGPRGARVVLWQPTHEGSQPVIGSNETEAPVPHERNYEAVTVDLVRR